MLERLAYHIILVLNERGWPLEGLDDLTNLSLDITTLGQAVLSLDFHDEHLLRIIATASHSLCLLWRYLIQKHHDLPDVAKGDRLLRHVIIALGRPAISKKLREDLLLGLEHHLLDDILRQMLFEVGDEFTDNPLAPPQEKVIVPLRDQALHVDEYDHAALVEEDLLGRDQAEERQTQGPESRDCEISIGIVHG